MGKMVYLLMTIISIQIGMYLVFDIGIPTSSLWDLFINPNNWDSLSLTTIIFDSITAISIVAFVGGLVFRNDLMIFGAIAGVFLSFGRQLIILWQNIASQPNFGDASSASMVASIIVAPIVFLYILVVLEWWRGRD